MGGMKLLASFGTDVFYEGPLHGGSERHCAARKDNPNSETKGEQFQFCSAIYHMSPIKVDAKRIQNVW
jgi:hypothetical protein